MKTESCWGSIVGFSYATILLFLALALGLNTIARTLVGGDRVLDAVAQCIREATAQPQGMVLLFIPSCLLGWMAASLALRRTPSVALGFFILGATLLSAVYGIGYFDSQIAISRRAWTAAALSIGFMPFECVPVLAVLFCVRLFLGRDAAV